MADILVTSPFQPFTLPTQFKAVFNGYIYCGTVDAVDPSVSQVQVYLVNEEGDKVPVAQPLRTNAGGYLVYNGQPAKFVTDSNHSLLVQDSLHAQIWYAPDISLVDPESAMTILGSQAREALRRSYAEAGYTLVAGSFEAGGTVATATNVLLYETEGKAYSWGGDLPKTVIAGSTPTTSGGTGPAAWIDRSGEILRTDVQEIQSYSDGYISATYRLKNLRLLAEANKKLKAGDPVVIVCVGDSITYGHDTVSADILPPDPGHVQTKAPIQYPMQIGSNLNLFTSSATTVINRGYSGDTARVGYERWTTNPSAHVAHIMYGINDSNGIFSATFAEYMEYMEKLVQKYVDWGCGVVLHTTTDQTFNNTNPASSYFTQSVRMIAETYGCPLFESEEIHQFRIYSSVHSDGIHFNKAGYAHYGNAVTSFILAGGWVHQYRKVNSLTHMQSGRSSEGIGFFGKGMTLGTNLASGYLTNGSLGVVPAGGSGIMSVHFYMDCDVADFSIVGDIVGLFAQIGKSIDPAFGDVNRLPIRSTQNRYIFESIGSTVATNRSGAGRNALLGTLVGRGWKTVYLQFNGTHVGDKYIQGMVIEPKCAAEATQQNYNNIRRGNDEVYIYQNPSFTPFGAAGLPAAINLTGDVFIPLPDGLFSYVSASNFFFDFAPVYVTVMVAGTSDPTNNPDGIVELVLRRTGPATTMTIHKVYGSAANSMTPTAAGIGASDYVESNASPVGVNKTTDPLGSQQGWLWLTFPANAYTAFYRIEVRCASKGTQSNWFA